MSPNSLRKPVERDTVITCAFSDATTASTSLCRVNAPSFMPTVANGRSTSWISADNSLASTLVQGTSAQHTSCETHGTNGCSWPHEHQRHSPGEVSEHDCAASCGGVLAAATLTLEQASVQQAHQCRHQHRPVGVCYEPCLATQAERRDLVAVPGRRNRRDTSP